MRAEQRLHVVIDQESLEFHGVDEQAVYDTIASIVGGVRIGYSQRGHGTKPIDISVRLPRAAMSPGASSFDVPSAFLTLRLASRRLAHDLPRFHPSFRFEERPYVIMTDHSSVELGSFR